jgi:hypothetical protein
VTDQAAPHDIGPKGTPPSQTEPVTAPAPAQRDIAGWLILVLGVGAALAGFLAAIGSGWGLWHFSAGLTGVKWAFFLALAALVAGLLFGWRARKSGHPSPKLRRWAGMAVAAVFVAIVGNWIYKGATHPAIHDVSTDLADPPGFRTLLLRADNYDNIPGGDDPEMRGLTPQQRWVVVHQQAYDDIRSVRINEPVPSVIAKAERLARDRDWDIAVALPEEGRLEASDTVSLFRFKDDIVLRVRPTETGEGSIVDMRSVSRVGVSDLGVNAERVRSFLADLTGTVTAER